MQMGILGNCITLSCFHFNPRKSTLFYNDENPYEKCP